MILLLNGAFGIGKTSVAHSVVKQRPDVGLVNPEPIGVGLQRGSRLLGIEVDDFQDLHMWRALTVQLVKAAAWRGKHVIVPMAFDNIDYLREIRLGLERSGMECHHVCLIAPEDVVHARLRQRGADTKRNAWEYRRASQCCIAHVRSEFATHVDANARTPDAIATELLRSWDFGTVS
ncbi:MAG TPA: AAA family ATPase [Gemmatimonadaceae bacterium]|nr:AAA family ATPase [Gemmatimonadaceae bacterium]